MLIDRDKDGDIVTTLFKPQQKAEQMLNILGYDTNEPKSISKKKLKERTIPVQG